MTDKHLDIAYKKLKKYLTTETTDEAKLQCSDLLVPFEDLPLGGRFKYPGGETIWTVLTKVRKETCGRVHGTIAEWQPKMLTFGYWPGQRICSHFPEECPEMVIGVN